jgi:hypothetical protein
LDDWSHNEAADHLTAAVNNSALSSEPAIHLKYEIFVVVCRYDSTRNTFHAQLCALQLFGWDLESFWETANQKRCSALLQAGRLEEAHEAYRYMMDMSDEATMVNCSD